MPMPKTTREDEFDRALDNPDNFIVSSGFEDIFEDLTSPEVSTSDALSISYAERKVSGSLLKMKMTRNKLVAVLSFRGIPASSWMKDYDCVGKICTVTNNHDLRLNGYLDGISCAPSPGDSTVVKYTILIDKNT